MAVNFGTPQPSPFGRFVQGFGSSFAAAQRRQQLLGLAEDRNKVRLKELEHKKKKLDFDAAKFFQDIAKPGQDPAVTDARIDAFVVGAGGDPSNPVAKRMKEFFRKASDETKRSAQQSATAMFPEFKKNPGQIAALANRIARGDITGLQTIFKMFTGQAEKAATAEAITPPPEPSVQIAGNIPGRPGTAVSARPLGTPEQEAITQKDRIVVGLRNRLASAKTSGQVDAITKKLNLLDPEPKIRTFVNDKGQNIRGVDITDREAVKKAIKDGLFPLTITLQSLQGLGQVITRAEAAKIRLQQTRTAGALQNMAGAFSKLKRLPSGATGFTANMAEALGGVAEQVADFFTGSGKEVGQSVTEFFAGIGPQELQQLRVQLRTIIAQNIGELTGEEGARISESERRLAERISRLTEGAASPPQIRGALLALMSFKIVQSERLNFERTGGFKFIIDDKLVAEFQNLLGVTKEDANEMVVELARLQTFMRRFAGDQ